MVEKILNNYFSKKLIEVFRTTALLRNIDLHIIPRKEKVTIYAKDRRFVDNYYKQVFEFKKEASIYYLSNILEAKKEFDKVLKYYQENNEVN